MSGPLLGAKPLFPAGTRHGVCDLGLCVLYLKVGRSQTCLPVNPGSSLRSYVTSEKLLNLSEPHSKNWNNNATTMSFYFF